MNTARLVPFGTFIVSPKHITFVSADDPKDRARFPKRLSAQIREAAAASGCTLEEFINRALRRAIYENETRKPSNGVA